MGISLQSPQSASTLRILTLHKGLGSWKQIQTSSFIKRIRYSRHFWWIQSRIGSTWMCWRHWKISPRSLQFTSSCLWNWTAQASGSDAENWRYVCTFRKSNLPPSFTILFIWSLWMTQNYRLDLDCTKLRFWCFSLYILRNFHSYKKSKVVE